MPDPKYEQEYGEHSSHATRGEFLRQSAAQQSSQENSGHDKQAYRPANLVGVCVIQEGKDADGRHQSDQTGALRGVLLETKQQHQERHQEHAAAYSEQARGNAHDTGHHQYQKQLESAIKHQVLSPRIAAAI